MSRRVYPRGLAPLPSPGFWTCSCGRLESGLYCTYSVEFLNHNATLVRKPRISGDDPRALTIILEYWRARLSTTVNSIARRSYLHSITFFLGLPSPTQIAIRSLGNCHAIIIALYFRSHEFVHDAVLTPATVTLTRQGQIRLDIHEEQDLPFRGPDKIPSKYLNRLQGGRKNEKLNSRLRTRSSEGKRYDDLFAIC